ncbi:uncharacterized protein LOC141613716 [Silene latifolia]|uniref:uncharacterized protein LOC141613716 n=1 Tax=Silene latifolia TaxID=37657 RepID=UPI003D78A095
MEIIYHEEKANVVADALSRKYIHALCTAMSRMKLREEVEKMGISMIKKGDTIGDLTIEPKLYEEIRKKQEGDARVARWREAVGEAVVEGGKKRFHVGSDGGLRFDGRRCVPDDEELKRKILTEAHFTPYYVHSGGDKLYKDLKKTFWWPKMKKEVAEFVARCLVCERVKGEHKRPQVLARIAIFDGDSVEDEYSISSSYRWSDTEDYSDLGGYAESLCIAPFEALYGKKCRSHVCWDDRADAVVLGPEMIQAMVEQVHIIRQKMRAAQDRQKSYADLKRSDIEFAVGDKVLLKVSSMRGVMRKYVSDPTHMLEPEHIEIDEQLSYVEEPKEILDRKVRKTRNGETALVKVLWSNHKVEEATWEAEAAMREKYPSPFI